MFTFRNNAIAKRNSEKSFDLSTPGLKTPAKSPTKTGDLSKLSQDVVKLVKLKLADDYNFSNESHSMSDSDKDAKKGSSETK